MVLYCLVSGACWLMYSGCALPIVVVAGAVYCNVCYWLSVRCFMLLFVARCCVLLAVSCLKCDVRYMLTVMWCLLFVGRWL